MLLSLRMCKCGQFGTNEARKFLTPRPQRRDRWDKLDKTPQKGPPNRFLRFSGSFLGFHGGRSGVLVRIQDTYHELAERHCIAPVHSHGSIRSHPNESSRQLSNVSINPYIVALARSQQNAETDAVHKVCMLISWRASSTNQRRLWRVYGPELGRPSPLRTVKTTADDLKIRADTVRKVWTSRSDSPLVSRVVHGDSSHGIHCHSGNIDCRGTLKRRRQKREE